MSGLHPSGSQSLQTTLRGRQSEGPGWARAVWASRGEVSWATSDKKVEGEKMTVFRSTSLLPQLPPDRGLGLERTAASWMDGEDGCLTPVGQ